MNGFGRPGLSHLGQPQPRPEDGPAARTAAKRLSLASSSNIRVCQERFGVLLSHVDHDSAPDVNLPVRRRVVQLPQDLLLRHLPVRHAGFAAHESIISLVRRRARGSVSLQFFWAWMAARRTSLMHWSCVLTLGISFLAMVSQTLRRRAFSCSTVRCFFFTAGSGASWENFAKILVM
ncbi:hypothetical protein EYF80_052347 [Liparis tanakae]|uniref:Uncharacterized protein n=1 Tax=Liparis tanakae TaxID=230148 RepID=A0A4Z2F8C8_9TELE|nr:hypothetical protein EYF80_052347 [Liparis tanakae]